MIKIGCPYIDRRDGRARLSADIIIDGKECNLWYEVSDEYADGLCADRGDAFVLAVLYYAMVKKHDIVSEAPLTWELKEGIERDFLDVVCEAFPGRKPYHVVITSACCNPILKERQVSATGISCGVDSLYSVKRRLVDGVSKDVGDQYLVLNDVHGAVVNDSESKHAARWERLLNQARRFSKKSNIPLIVGRTNFNANAIPGLSFEFSTTSGNLFSAFAMQNLFTDYYLASGGPLENLRDCIEGGIFSVQPDDYDLLYCAAVSTRSLKVVSDGLAFRVEKIRALSDWPLAQNFLDVCHVHAEGSVKNGTNDCPKCMHTVVELLAQGPGVLERFSNVFDVDYVLSHKDEYLAELMRRRFIGVQSAKESWAYKSAMGFSFSDYVSAAIIFMRKAVKKVLRRGSVSQTFRPRG